MNTENPFKSFSASKMSENPRFNVSETTKINSILGEYPVVMGKFPKKFHKEIKSDLQSAGFGMCSKYLLK